MTSEHLITLDNRTFRVLLNIGDYDELLSVPVADLRPSEDLHWKNLRDVDRYARMFDNGSPFPPIHVAGPVPEDPTFHILNGHHRYLAALKVGATHMDAWVTPYIDRGPDCYGKPIWMPALLSLTPIGRRIAELMNLQWCPACGLLLNYEPGAPVCGSCRYSSQTLEETFAYYAPQKARLGY